MVGGCQAEPSALVSRSSRRHSNGRAPSSASLRSGRRRLRRIGRIFERSGIIVPAECGAGRATASSAVARDENRSPKRRADEESRCAPSSNRRTGPTAAPTQPGRINRLLCFRARDNRATRITRAAKLLTAGLFRSFVSCFFDARRGAPGLLSQFASGPPEGPPMPRAPLSGRKVLFDANSNSAAGGHSLGLEPLGLRCER